MKRPILSRRAGGFTLVELVVAVAIIGVLSAIAVPSYMSYTERTHRSAAKAILVETAQFMERHYTNNNTYVGGALVSAVSPKGATGSAVRYNITFSAGPAASTFTLQAAPAGRQTSDECGTMTLSNTGAQTAAVAGCW